MTERWLSAGTCAGIPHIFLSPHRSSFDELPLGQAALRYAMPLFTCQPVVIESILGNEQCHVRGYRR